jgi:hypothetical protein
LTAEAIEYNKYIAAWTHFGQVMARGFYRPSVVGGFGLSCKVHDHEFAPQTVTPLITLHSGAPLITQAAAFARTELPGPGGFVVLDHHRLMRSLNANAFFAAVLNALPNPSTGVPNKLGIARGTGPLHSLWSSAEAHVSYLYVLAVGYSAKILVGGRVFALPPYEAAWIAMPPRTQQRQVIEVECGTDPGSWVQVAFHDPSAASAYQMPVMAKIAEMRDGAAVVAAMAAPGTLPSAMDLPAVPADRSLALPASDYLPILKSVLYDPLMQRPFKKETTYNPLVHPSDRGTWAGKPLEFYVDEFIPRDRIGPNIRGPEQQKEAVPQYIKRVNGNVPIVFFPRVKDDTVLYAYDRARPSEAPYIRDPNRFYRAEGIPSHEPFHRMRVLTDASWDMFATEPPVVNKLDEGWVDRTQTGAVIALSGGSLEEIPFFNPSAAPRIENRHLKASLSASPLFPERAYTEWLRLNPLWRKYTQGDPNPFDLLAHPLTAFAGVPSTWLHATGSYGPVAAAITAAYITLFVEAALEVINTPAPGQQGQPGAKILMKESKVKPYTVTVPELALKKAEFFARHLCKMPLIGRLSLQQVYGGHTDQRKVPLTAMGGYPSILHAIADSARVRVVRIRNAPTVYTRWLDASNALESAVVSIVIDLTRRIRRIVNLGTPRPALEAAPAAAAAAAAASAALENAAAAMEHDPVTGARMKRSAPDAAPAAAAAGAGAGAAAAAAAASSSSSGSKRQKVSRAPVTFPAAMFVTGDGRRRLAPVFLSTIYSRMIADVLGWSKGWAETQLLPTEPIQYTPVEDAHDMLTAVVTTVPFLNTAKAMSWTQPATEPLPAVKFTFDVSDQGAIDVRITAILNLLTVLQSTFAASAVPVVGGGGGAPAAAAAAGAGAGGQALSSFSSIDAKMLQMLPSYRGLSLPDCLMKFREMERLQAIELKQLESEEGSSSAPVPVTGGGVGAMRCLPRTNPSDIDWDGWVRRTPARRMHIVFAYHEQAVLFGGGAAMKHPIKSATVLSAARASGAVGNHRALKFMVSVSKSVEVQSIFDSVQKRQPATGGKPAKRKLADDPSDETPPERPAAAAAAAAAAASAAEESDVNSSSPYMSEADYKSAVADDATPPTVWQVFYMPKDRWVELKDPRESITAAQKAMWAADPYEQAQNDPRLMLMAPVAGRPDQSEFDQAIGAFLLRASDAEKRVVALAPLVAAYRTALTESKDGKPQSEWILMLYSGSMEPRVPVETVSRFVLDGHAAIRNDDINPQLANSLVELITLSNTRVDLKSRPLSAPVFAFTYGAGAPGTIPIGVRPYIGTGIRVEDLQPAAVANAVADEFFHAHSASGVKSNSWVTNTYLAVYVKSRKSGQMNCAGLYRGRMPAVVGDPWYQAIGDTPAEADDDDGNVVFDWQEHFPRLIEDDVQQRAAAVAAAAAEEESAALRPTHAKRQRIGAAPAAAK